VSPLPCAPSQPRLTCCSVRCPQRSLFGASQVACALSAGDSGPYTAVDTTAPTTASSIFVAQQAVIGVEGRVNGRSPLPVDVHARGVCDECARPAHRIDPARQTLRRDVESQPGEEGAARSPCILDPLYSRRKRAIELSAVRSNFYFVAFYFSASSSVCFNCAAVLAALKPTKRFKSQASREMTKLCGIDVFPCIRDAATWSGAQPIR
jgi:hypothetical protein